MFLGNLLNANKNVTFYNSNSDTVPVFYNIWRELLCERIMNLFTWNSDVSEKEIEQRLLLTGTCGIAYYKDSLTAFYGNFYGVTKYYDEYTHYIVNSPVYSKELEIGKEIAVIDNNKLRNSITPLIHMYATLLAHNDVTMIHTLVNGRETGGTPVAGTQKVSESIKQYRSSLKKGIFNPIIDGAFLNAKFIDSHRTNQVLIKDLAETRKNLMSDFYNAIGVRTAWSKKGNMIVEEVTGNDSMVLFNINDMLESRKKGCEKINKLFNVNWTVEKNKELIYREDDSYNE